MVDYLTVSVDKISQEFGVCHTWNATITPGIAKRPIQFMFWFTV